MFSMLADFLNSTAGRFLRATALLVGCYCVIPHSLLAEEHFEPRHLLDEQQLREAANQLVMGQALKQVEFSDNGVDTGEHWRGNSPKIEVDFSSAEIELGGGELPLAIGLGIDGTGFIIRHPRPKERNYLGGVRLRGVAGTPSRFFFESAVDESLAIVVSSSGSPEISALLMCPRRYRAPRYQGEKPHLANRSFEYLGSRFAVQGSISAYVLGGLNPARASAELQTTRNVPPSHVRYDESVRRDPRVQVTYRNDEVQPAELEVGTSAGIRATVDLTLPSGLTRRTFREAVMQIEMVELDAKGEMQYRGRATILEPGPCVFVYRSIYSWHEYSQQAPVSGD